MKTHNKSKNVKILIVILCVALVAMATVVWVQHAHIDRLKEDGTQPEQTLSSEDGKPDDGSELTLPENMVEFPFSAEDGKIEITSLFQFTGFNPDCAGEEGSNIAAVQIRNVSAEHLTHAEITMEMNSGKQLRFVLEDLAPGISAMVFDAENTEIDSADVCVEVTCESSYEAQSPTMAEQIGVEVQDYVITLTNLTGEDLENLMVHCHCMMEDESFGGLTYQYPVECIRAGESVTVEAVDCFLGPATVARIEIQK